MQFRTWVYYCVLKAMKWWQCPDIMTELKFPVEEALLGNHSVISSHRWRRGKKRGRGGTFSTDLKVICIVSFMPVLYWVCLTLTLSFLWYWPALPRCQIPKTGLLQCRQQIITNSRNQSTVTLPITGCFVPDAAHQNFGCKYWIRSRLHQTFFFSFCLIKIYGGKKLNCKFPTSTKGLSLALPLLE